VWPGLAATTAARDGARSIYLHATKIRKVLTATANDEPGDEAAAARRLRRGGPDLLHDDDDGSRIN
jgi:hypothetical protein